MRTIYQSVNTGKCYQSKQDKQPVTVDLSLYREGESNEMWKVFHLVETAPISFKKPFILNPF